MFIAFASGESDCCCSNSFSKSLYKCIKKKYLGKCKIFIGEFYRTSLCFYREENIWHGIYHKTFTVALEDGGQIALLRTYDHTTTLW